MSTDGADRQELLRLVSECKYLRFRLDETERKLDKLVKTMWPTEERLPPTSSGRRQQEEESSMTDDDLQ